MDNKRIIFTNADGNMSVIVPAPGCTEEQALKAVPAGLPYEIVNAEDVPADRTFRNAWQHDTTPAPQKVAIDMVKAKDSTHEKRRALRSTEFAPLDVEATIPSKAASAEANVRLFVTSTTVFRLTLTPHLLPINLKRSLLPKDCK